MLTGIYPLTTMWATTGPSFRQLYPVDTSLPCQSVSIDNHTVRPFTVMNVLNVQDIEVTTCGASVLFFCPVLRDFLMWAGARDVSKPALGPSCHSFLIIFPLLIGGFVNKW
jgi:hypothetical protein